MESIIKKLIDQCKELFTSKEIVYKFTTLETSQKNHIQTT